MPQLKAGTLASFENSMAQSIEQALDAALQEAGFPPLPDPKTADPGEQTSRRILFVAIAQGVVNYLRANEDAIQFNFDAGDHGHANNSQGEHFHSGHATLWVI